MYSSLLVPDHLGVAHTHACGRPPAFSETIRHRGDRSPPPATLGSFPRCLSAPATSSASIAASAAPNRSAQIRRPTHRPHRPGPADDPLDSSSGQPTRSPRHPHAGDGYGSPPSLPPRKPRGTEPPRSQRPRGGIEGREPRNPGRSAPAQLRFVSCERLATASDDFDEPGRTDPTTIEPHTASTPRALGPRSLTHRPPNPSVKRSTTKAEILIQSPGPPLTRVTAPTADRHQYQHNG